MVSLSILICLLGFFGEQKIFVNVSLFFRLFISGEIISLKNTPRMTQMDTLQKIFSPQKTEACVKLTLKEDFVITNMLFTLSHQQIILSQDKALRQMSFSHMMERHCKCVIGISGGSRKANYSSLEIVSKMIKLVQWHVIVLQRAEKPTNHEMKMQYRSLLWIEGTGKVSAILYAEKFLHHLHALYTVY